jgi:hypothetical protein
VNEDPALLGWLDRCLGVFGLPWASIYGKQLREQLTVLHRRGLVFTPEELTGVNEGLERLREIERDLGEARRPRRRWRLSR